MGGLDRRAALKAAAGVAACAATFSIARAEPIELKFANDPPATHSLDVRQTQAIEAISDKTKGEVAISLFPNNQLGNDKG